jgi:DUF1680 family protein
MRLRPAAYSQVEFRDGVQETQLHQTQSVLMNLTNDELLKPFRVRSGKDAPGPNLGGWYDADAYCPGHTLGQWMSSFARFHAISGSESARTKVNQLVTGLGDSFDAKGSFFAADNRFPAYTLEKLNCGLIDALTFCKDVNAADVLNKVNRLAQPHLPEKALSRAEQRARTTRDISYTYDESYTLPENYFLAYQRTGDAQYRNLGMKFMHHGFLDPLVAGQNVLPGLHAYSHLNALNSATQAYLTVGDRNALAAAINGFTFVEQQSFATGGWGPGEQFVAPGMGNLGKSLNTTHNSFETPCGAYGHFKLTRSLLSITGDAHYGDSMEAIMYNTVLGSLPLQPDGSAFYYSDYDSVGIKVYHGGKWPCCSGTLAQVSADYRLSTYLQDDAGVYVNLYIPSTFRGLHQETGIELEQSGNYPLDGDIHITLHPSRSTRFCVNLRLPAWAGTGGHLSINGQATPLPAPVKGFCAIDRTWIAGDSLTLSLPLKARLQVVDPETPGIVALLRGPLVLFGVGAPVAVTETALLAARQTGPTEWSVQTAAGDRRFIPFDRIAREPYSTYNSLI